MGLFEEDEVIDEVRAVVYKFDAKHFRYLYMGRIKRCSGHFMCLKLSDESSSLPKVCQNEMRLNTFVSEI